MPLLKFQPSYIVYQKHNIKIGLINVHRKYILIILQCYKLKNEIKILKKNVLKEGNWPASKSELNNRNLEQSIRHINSMEFVKINHPKENTQMNTTNKNVRLQ